MKQSVENRRAIVNAAGTQAVNVQSFLKIVKKYTEPTELTPAILREFVEKVVVHTPDKSSGHWVQRIDVHYAFIGEIDLSPEYSKLSTGKRPLHDDLASCGGFPPGKLLNQGSLLTAFFAPAGVYPM